MSARYFQTSIVKLWQLRCYHRKVLINILSLRKFQDFTVHKISRMKIYQLVIVCTFGYQPPPPPPLKITTLTSPFHQAPS